MTPTRTVSEADLRRLKHEREEADRRYNEALSALDSALHVTRELPHPPPPPDEAQVTPLNTQWEILARRPAFPAGWRGRLAGFVWHLVEPALASQQTFNAALVDHVNRNIPPQREISKSIESTIAVLRDQVEQLIRFESRLIAYLQQITPFVDTKDYEFNGLARRVDEDLHESHQRLDRTSRGLAATLSGISDEMLKRWERYEGLRASTVLSLATLQQSVQALRREVETAGARHTPESSAREDVRSVLPPPDGAPRDLSYSLSSSPRDSHTYVSFEDAFRGEPELIRARQRMYLPLFKDRSDVLDVGCGRGEFLVLLKEAGVTARGVDVNHAMVAQCQAAGLDVREGGALEYLRSVSDESLGGMLAAQVVEHLPPDYLIAMLQEAFRALQRGSPIVLETINVASWSAFFNSYVRDLTHAQPIHPETLQFLVVACGFVDAEVRLSSPLPDAEKLQSIPRVVRDMDLSASPGQGRAMLEVANTFDANVERLNRQLYGPQDYAVVAWKR